MPQFYVKGAEKAMQAQINWLSDTIKIAAVTNAYPQNLTTDEFFSTISTYVVGTPQTLANKSVTGGVFNADDPNFATLAGGTTLEALVIYKDTGNAATSPLLIYNSDVLGFPLATNGGDVGPQFDNGAYKIFSMIP